MAAPTYLDAILNQQIPLLVVLLNQSGSAINMQSDADGTPAANVQPVMSLLYNGNNNGDRPRGINAVGDNANFGFPPAGSMLFNGASWNPQRVPTVFQNVAAVAITAGTPVNVWSPAGKKFRLMGFALSLSVAGSVIIKDNNTEILRTPLLTAGNGLSSPNMGNGILSATAGNILKLDVSASGNVSGFVFGTEE